MNRLTAFLHALAALLVSVPARLRTRLEVASAQSDRGDISITTVIIWVAATAGALAIAGTIAAVVARYNGQLSGI
ncbi:hypothetical protein LIX60_30730 [Streptomyces sp. S07_1.15]|uniref:hypothetical protein n=1 Tax=Streptomyces sp. S07_1.15 TaxID=2873925 RepID=UPI001D154028|nr:hypothetical protein [Streptomyces sp. S07_1.15]MCC3655758.1 hypothetical protein [Streptomyces sp. S07_1.15]